MKLIRKISVAALCAAVLLSGWLAPVQAEEWRDVYDIFIPGYRTSREPKSTVNVNVSGADLSGAMLTGADMEKDNYALVNFTNAMLSQADMRKGIFRGANFYGADLTGARMRKGDFVGANFRKADLGGADLSKAKLYKAVYDKHTRLPNFFVPEEHGMIFVNDEP